MSKLKKKAVFFESLVASFMGLWSLIWVGGLFPMIGTWATVGIVLFVIIISFSIFHYTECFGGD